jgi:hypothetical protein
MPEEAHRTLLVQLQRAANLTRSAFLEGFSLRDAITLYEQAQHLMAEPMQLLGHLTMLSAPEIEHLYTHLGRAYELNAEWEKARAVYTMMLAYAQEAGELVMESNAQSCQAALAAQ